jgi:acetyl-CoA carboxylase alpha subunit
MKYLFFARCAAHPMHGSRPYEETAAVKGKMVKIHRKPAIAVIGDQNRIMPLSAFHSTGMNGTKMGRRGE